MIEIYDLKKEYLTASGRFVAVDSVSLKLPKHQKYDTYSRFYGDTLTGVAYKKGTWG